MSPLKSRQPPTAQSSRPRSAPAPVACCHCDTARVVTNRALPASSHRASASPSQIAHASQPRTPRYVSGRMIDLRYASTDVPGPSAIAVSRRSSHLASSRDQPARTLAPLLPSLPRAAENQPGLSPGAQRAAACSPARCSSCPYSAKDPRVRRQLARLVHPSVHRTTLVECLGMHAI